MKLTDIRKVDRNDLPNQDFKDLYDQLKQESEDFNEDLLELFEDEVNEFLKFVKKFKPEAIKTQPVKKAPEKAPKEPVIEFDAPDVVKQVMEDYNLTQDKAERLIALRLEAIELKKENLDKLLDRLAETEFYTGKLSKAPIDRNRTRDLGKDSKQGSITLAEERKMTGKPFKRISKAGGKNQYGTTEGGKVYYEYRMNRRDVDNKIKLATGGDIPNADKMFHLPYELAVYVPSTQDVNKSITASELRARVKEVEKYLAETFGGFTSAEKVGGYLSSKSSIITEKVVPVTAFSSMQDFRANKSKLINKMSLWAKKWGQEAIGFEFEGDLYYVPQKFKTGGKLKATYIPKSDIKTLSTIWGNTIKGKDLLDGAYTTRKNIKTQPKVIRYFDGDEGYEYGEGGEILDYKVGDYIFDGKDTEKTNPLAITKITDDKVYTSSLSLLDQPLRHYPHTRKFFDRDIKAGHYLIGKRGFFTKLFNTDKEKFKRNYKTGGALVDTSINFGYDKRVKGKRLASSGTQIELRQNTKSGEYCVFVDLYPIKETKTEFSEEAEQEYLFQIGFYEYRSGARSTMPQKPKMIRSIIEEEEYEYFKTGGKTGKKSYQVEVEYKSKNDSEDWSGNDLFVTEVLANSEAEAEELGIARFKEKHSEKIAYVNVDKNDYEENVFDKMFKENRFAKGGMLEHGLQVGDQVISYNNTHGTIVVQNKGVNYQIDLNTGTRRTMFTIKAD